MTKSEDAAVVGARIISRDNMKVEAISTKNVTLAMFDVKPIAKTTLVEPVPFELRNLGAKALDVIVVGMTFDKGITALTGTGTFVARSDVKSCTDIRRGLKSPARIAG